MKCILLAAITATLLSSCCGQCGTGAVPPADKPAATNAPPAAPSVPAAPASPAAAEAPKP